MARELTAVGRVVTVRLKGFARSTNARVRWRACVSIQYVVGSGELMLHHFTTTAAVDVAAAIALWPAYISECMVIPLCPWSQGA